MHEASREDRIGSEPPEWARRSRSDGNLSNTPDKMSRVAACKTTSSQVQIIWLTGIIGYVAHCGGFKWEA